jgi:hypothetical protein
VPISWHQTGHSGRRGAQRDAVASGKRRNAPDGRFDATGGRVLLTEFSVALCLKCAHYSAKRALPSGKIIPVK